MKRLALLATACAVFAAPALAQTGVSVSVGQPGFYGRIDIGGYPPPPVIYPQPVIIQQAVVGYGPPLYMHVPPGHAKHWAKHCAKYGACAQPVYFVQDGWYQNVYVPGYAYGKGKGKGGKHRDAD
jgi:hypothetical protein